MTFAHVQGIVLAIGYLALLLYLMRRIAFFQGIPGLSFRAIVAILLLKTLAGTALWAVYTWGYPDRSMADIFKYFDDSQVMHDALRTHPMDFLRMLTGIDNDSAYFTERYYLVMNNWVRRFETGVYNDSHTMIRFNALLRILSFGQYHVHTVFASFLSTAGLVALYRALQPLVKGLERGLLLAVFAWPSLLFWSSGPLKESLLMLGFGLFLLGAIGTATRIRAGRRILLLVVGLAVMLVVKSYVLLCLLPGLFTWYWVRHSPRRALFRFVGVHVLAIASVLVLGQLLPGQDPLYVIALKQRDFLGMAREVASGSMLDVPPLEPTWGSFMRHLPIAVHLSFLSPFEMAGKGPLALAAAAENLFVLGLPLLALAFRRPWRAMDKASLLLAISFITSLGLLIGYTVPVVGALVRYRIPFLPFIGLLSLLMVDPQRLPRRMQKLLNS